MKTWVAFLACFAILFLPLPAEAAARASVTGKAYNVEVRSVDVVYSLDGTFRALETVRTTGRQEKVNEVRFAYDFEQEQPEAAGRFLEDQTVEEDFRLAVRREGDAETLLFFSVFFSLREFHFSRQASVVDERELRRRLNRKFGRFRRLD